MESKEEIDARVSYLESDVSLLNPVLINLKKGDLLDRFLGCAYGQALGDAYGLCTEFLTRAEVATKYSDSTKLIPFPAHIATQHAGRWKRGDWTDDTDQWILVMETLMDPNSDEKVFARKLSLWVRQGFPELDDFGGLGLGINVAKVICSDGYLQDPLKISRDVWEQSERQAAPNGGVMRCSASGLAYYNNIEKVKSTAIWMCQTTHFDPRCVASCIAICLAVAYVLQTGEIDDIEVLIDHVRFETIETLGENLLSNHREEFLWHTSRDRTLDDLCLDDRKYIGYTYKCLASGFYGLRSTRPFAETLNDLIRYGGDADTNGAVCGTMYGARHGYSALPAPWLRTMPYLKWFDQKMLRLINLMKLTN